MGCGNRLKFEDSRDQAQPIQDPWEDPPDVSKGRNKKDVAGFCASMGGLAAMMGIGFFLVKNFEAIGMQEPTPRQLFGGVWLIYSGFNTLVLGISLWIYFRPEDSPFRHGVLDGIKKCAILNLLMGGIGYVFMFLAPEILSSRFGSDVDWGLLGQLPMPVILFAGMKWLFDSEIWETIGLMLVQAGVYWGIDYLMNMIK